MGKRILMHSEWPKLYRVLVVLSAIGVRIGLLWKRFWYVGKQTRSV